MGAIGATGQGEARAARDRQPGVERSGKWIGNWRGDAQSEDLCNQQEVARSGRGDTILCQTTGKQTELLAGAKADHSH